VTQTCHGDRKCRKMKIALQHFTLDSESEQVSVLKEMKVLYPGRTRPREESSRSYISEYLKLGFTHGRDKQGSD